jgi:hypothetical protein
MKELYINHDGLTVKAQKESKMARQAINGQRKNLVLSTTTDERIKAIRSVSDLPSDAEVIRKAIDLYTQVIKFQAIGQRVSYTTEQGTTDLQTVFKTELMTSVDDTTLGYLGIPRKALKLEGNLVFEMT